jgi:hypothetical protein
MAQYDQAWIVGGIFCLVTALLIASLMRESIPYKVRRGIQVFAFLCALGLAGFAVVQKSSRVPSMSLSWPTLDTPTAKAEPPTPPQTKPKASAKPQATEWHAATNLNRRLAVGTMREVSPEEARRLLAQKQPRP